MARSRRAPADEPLDETQPEDDSRASSRGSSRPSTATGGSNPFGLEDAAFEPGAEVSPQLEPEGDPYEPPAPELILWTSERAGFLLRAAGALLHTADSASHVAIAAHLERPPAGESCSCEACELWRMTQRNVDEMGPPLAAILNRYAAARRLAGFSDEGALAFGMLAYATQNLAARGRIVAEGRAAEETLPEPPAWQRPETPPEGWQEGPS